MSNHHRPASEWLTQLQRTKTESVNSSKPKATIHDVMERANDPACPPAALIPTSPRSIEACFRLGIDPLDLVYLPLAAFRKAGEPDDLAEMRYEHAESLRQERLKDLMEERKQLVESGVEFASSKSFRGSGKSAELDEGVTSAMIEKEKHKLEVLRRRQERDMQQMVQYEVTRKQLLDKQQRKIDAMEARAAELRRQKEAKEREWAEQQRERELIKVAEEQALEREAQRSAAERYRREKELQAREAAEAKRRKKEAMAREIERREKVEESRRATERILAHQEAEVKARKAEMEKRDAERRARMAEEAHLREVANAAKRKQAEERISSALEANAALLRKKRTDFEYKEAASEVRRAEMEKEHRLAEENKRQQEVQGEAERQAKYQLALAREEARKQAIRDHAASKEASMNEANAIRTHGNDVRKVERELYNELRRDKVDSIQKMQAYQRQLLLEKIMDDNDKTQRLLGQREAIQAQRKAANMRASLHRHRVNQLMESMKNVHNIEKLAPNGQVDMSALTRQLGSM